MKSSTWALSFGIKCQVFLVNHAYFILTNRVQDQPNSYSRKSYSHRQTLHSREGLVAICTFNYDSLAKRFNIWFWRVRGRSSTHQLTHFSNVSKYACNSWHKRCYRNSFSCIRWIWWAWCRYIWWQVLIRSLKIASSFQGFYNVA